MRPRYLVGGLEECEVLVKESVFAVSGVVCIFYNDFGFRHYARVGGAGCQMYPSGKCYH